MKILDLTIHGFGKFHDRKLSFTDGLNIIYGHNEAGKSTLHSFLRAMLYGMEKKPGLTKKSELYEKYEPWDNADVFGGELRFSWQSKTYRVMRDFRKEHESLRIINETDQTELREPEALLTDALDGVTETAYNNTVSIGQLKCQTGREMARELKSYIQSIHTTGDANLNAERAISYLRNQKNTMEQRLVPDAARTYTALIGEIRNIERDISQPSYANQLNKYNELRNSARTERTSRQTRKEELLQKIAQSEQVLQQSGYKNEAEISAAQEKTESLYKSFEESVKESKKAVRIILPVMFLGLSALSLMFGVAAVLLTGSSGMSGWQTLLPGVSAALSHMRLPVVLAVSLLLCILFLAAGITTLRQNHMIRKRVEETSAQAKEILARQIGCSDLSEDAMHALHSHMEELKNVYHQLTDNRTELAALDEELGKLTEDERAYDSKLQHQHEMQTELEGKLEHLANIKNRAEQLQRTLSENDHITGELDAISLAMETMSDLSKSIHSSFGHYLNKEAGSLISGITGGAYDSMWIDNSLRVYLNTPDKLVPIEHVSSGTMDQIYLALRLAASQLLQTGSSEKLPLIFDDSFAMYDEDRLRTAIHFVMQEYPGQILLFTCHTREARILEEDHTAFHLIRL